MILSHLYNAITHSIHRICDKDNKNLCKNPKFSEKKR
jgi:hypothetical protein